MAEARTLIWTAPALDDLDDLAAWIAEDDPDLAARVVARVLEGVERLRRFPASGRRVAEAPGGLYREIVVPPYRIIYRRDGARLAIIAVLRGRRPLRSPLE